MRTFGQPAHGIQLGAVGAALQDRPCRERVDLLARDAGGGAALQEVAQGREPLFRGEGQAGAREFDDDTEVGFAGDGDFGHVGWWWRWWWR